MDIDIHRGSPATGILRRAIGGTTECQAAQALWRSEQPKLVHGDVAPFGH